MKLIRWFVLTTLHHDFVLNNTIIVVLKKFTVLKFYTRKVAMLIKLITYFIRNIL